MSKDLHLLKQILSYNCIKFALGKLFLHVQSFIYHFKRKNMGCVSSCCPCVSMSGDKIAPPLSFCSCLNFRAARMQKSSLFTREHLLRWLGTKQMSTSGMRLGPDFFSFLKGRNKKPLPVLCHLTVSLINKSIPSIVSVNLHVSLINTSIFTL